ncbi:MAG: DNA-binding protein [Woeseia sp.]
MILTEEQRDAFAVYIARKPEAGAVVPGGGGIRKVRWGGRSKGKSGGARIIYFNQLAIGEIWLLTI